MPQAIFELSFHAGTGLQKTDIESKQGNVFKRRWHIAFGNTQRKSLDNGGFTDARLAGQDGIILTAAHQDIDNLPYLFVAPGYGINFTLARFFG